MEKVQSKEKNYMSQEGFFRLKTEINQLERIERPKVTELVAWAASLGDRSENADYQYGKKRLREIDSRLRFLYTRLNSAEVVDYLSFGNVSEIRFGATVEVQSEDGEMKKITIVGVDEINIGYGRISWKSPLGSALLGKKVGQEFDFSNQNGMTRLEILSVEYIPWPT